jgi:hypothetical protein
VYIFVVLRNKHTFTILFNSFLFPPHLCHAHAAEDFVKCASYCLMILFYKFRYIDYIFS